MCLRIVYGRDIEKLYVIDFDFVVRFIKIELGELGEFVFCVIVLQYFVVVVV